MERDRFMTPEDSKEFGLIDDVVSSRPQDADDANGKDS